MIPILILILIIVFVIWLVRRSNNGPGNMNGPGMYVNDPYYNGPMQNDGVADSFIAGAAMGALADELVNDFDDQPQQNYPDNNGNDQDNSNNGNNDNSWDNNDNSSSDDSGSSFDDASFNDDNNF